MTAATTPCDAVREAVSAAHDGEDLALPATVVREHLGACTSCRAFDAALARVDRQVALAGVDPTLDRTAGILAAVTADAEGDRARRQRTLRVLVGLSGVVQLVLALPVLLGRTGPALHVGRDLGAFGLALGAGLLVSAWQPWRAAGVLPIAAVVAVLATIGGVVDLAAGRASLVSELSHLAELVGVAALWALTRQLPDARVLVPAAAGPSGPRWGA